VPADCDILLSLTVRFRHSHVRLRALFISLTHGRFFCARLVYRYGKLTDHGNAVLTNARRHLVDRSPILGLDG